MMSWTLGTKHLPKYDSAAPLVHHNLRAEELTCTKVGNSASFSLQNWQARVRVNPD